MDCFKQTNGLLSCSKDAWHDRLFSITVPLRVHKIGLDDVEFCASVEETLTWI